MLDPDIRSSETIYSIPPRLRHCHLFNYDWNRVSVNDQGEEAVQDFLEQWGEGEAPHLILIGPPGVGKSHISIGIFRRGVYETNLTESVYIHVPDFCDHVKKSFDDDSIKDPFTFVREASLVVLDDLFGRDFSQWDIDNTIARLITITYDTGASVVVTTNYGVDLISSKIHPHEASRLFANSQTLILKGKDQRL